MDGTNEHMRQSSKFLKLPRIAEIVFFFREIPSAKGITSIDLA